MKHAVIFLTSMGALSVGCAQLDQRQEGPRKSSALIHVGVAEPSPAVSDIEPPERSPSGVEQVDFTALEAPINASTTRLESIEGHPSVDHQRSIQSGAGEGSQQWVVATADAISLQSPSDMDVTEEAAGYTLDGLEQLALMNHPSLSAARQGEAVATGLRHQVGLLPNPTVGYFGQQLADQNTDQHGVFVEQEIVRGRKLELNRLALGHTVNAQRWETWTQQQRVLTDVRLRFYEALAAQMQVDTTREFLNVAEKGVKVAEDRLNAGEGTRIDVLQSQTLLSATELAIQQREAVLKGTLRDLAAVIGMPNLQVDRLDGELIVPAEEQPQITFDEILSRSPELSTAQALVCEKRALLERQQAQPIPNLTAQLGAGYDNGTGSGMINVQVGAPIPVWNKNSGNVCAALAAYRRAVQNVERIEAAIKSRYARTTQEYESAVAALRRYRSEIIPQTGESLQLSEESYAAGELDFLQVLVVRQSFYEARIREIEANGQVNQALAKLEGLLLTGGLEAPADYTDGDGIRGASFGGQ